ncbi:sigma-70 family RNA polymerase sigma factor [Paenibacillus sp. GP183]|uniref:RNA polymerase sigma factor n=1 Tax=Paenibacillus sp. GP183 TaxID=1882751 RepID=UPI00089AB7C4|nr:sigma-70 family RNA polymerase sigma factor [Paenibacillus sp. GP183]SEB46067.1 RNA polymerase sigma-70 factor, ECF subfamily [Paenibacillus sp. GP183]
MDEELYRLIREAKQGEKKAFAELIKRYKGHIYRHAYGVLGNRMEAEDVAQEAFLKAYYSLSRLDNEYAFSAWIFRIVTNLCRDRLKKLGRERTLSTELLQQMATKRVEDNHLRLTIEEAMKQLTPDHREVILLHDVQGYRYDEMAEILTIPLGTVKSRLNAARLALRNEMKKGDE